MTKKKTAKKKQSKYDPNVFNEVEWSDVLAPYLAVKADMASRGYGDRVPNGWLKKYLEIDVPALYQGRTVTPQAFIQRYQRGEKKREQEAKGE